MRFSRIFASILLLLALASATEVKVKVVDPSSAAVAGAQVELLQQDAVVAVTATSAEGLAAFQNVSNGPYQVRVLAPGFAASTTEGVSPSSSPVSVRLALAQPAETVVVSATRNPAPNETSGAAVEMLSADQLQAMQPVAANDALRFLPGAVISTAGQRGGLGSLFVRGGDSRYNKVIVDGVPVNDPGGIFDFGVFPLTEADRVEFVRGAQSTLYGSDAMTSVVQVWSRAGSTPVPELRFSADGGNFSTAAGDASLAGARGRFDYNVFGDQFNTAGEGVNNDYSNTTEGGNIGVVLSDRVSLRLRARHSNSRSGVSGEWNFNGDPIIPPDTDQRVRQNIFLGSVELAVRGPSRWQHQISGFEFHLKRDNLNQISDPLRVDAFGFSVDTPFHSISNINRAGFDYQGDYSERSWAHTTVGYQFEDENGTVGGLPDSLSHGVRLNHAVFLQQTVTWGRLSAVAGGRFVHNASFGNTAVPRLSLNLLALKGGPIFSGTRLRFAFATGIKEPSFAESFGNGGGFPILPNPNLKAEEATAFETGLEQKFSANYSLTATYFNNIYRNKIDFNFLGCNPVCTGQYVNVNKALAHGAELALDARPLSRLSLQAAYIYTSTQILKAPFAFDPLLAAGQPLIRRPRHLGSLLLTYVGNRWGANLGGSFVGRRPDSDFFSYGIDHAPGYARLDLGGWYAVNSHLTAFVNLENALDKQYNEVVGYPALGANFRAGMRFRFGGE
jgi:outer membrane cobalamin receptor